MDSFLDKLNEASGCDISTLPTDTTRYHQGNVAAGCYRLPTEAEWEYSARAGTTTRFSYGDDEGYIQLGDYAWFWDNSGSKTHPIGQKLANPWGLYDMHGNVYEWVYDWYGSYPSSSQNDPSGPTTGSSRVVRGGGWRNDSRPLRSATRSIITPSGYVQYKELGFRLLLVK